MMGSDNDMAWTVSDIHNFRTFCFDPIYSAITDDGCYPGLWGAPFSLKVWKCEGFRVWAKTSQLGEFVVGSGKITQPGGPCLRCDPPVLLNECTSIAAPGCTSVRPTQTPYVACWGFSPHHTPVFPSSCVSSHLLFSPSLLPLLPDAIWFKKIDSYEFNKKDQWLMLYPQYILAFTGTFWINAQAQALFPMVAISGWCRGVIEVWRPFKTPYVGRCIFFSSVLCLSSLSTGTRSYDLASSYFMPKAGFESTCNKKIQNSGSNPIIPWNTKDSVDLGFRRSTYWARTLETGDISMDTCPGCPL